jgi:hypothetical protein
MAPCSGLANKGPVCPLCLPAVLRLQRAVSRMAALEVGRAPEQTNAALNLMTVQLTS